MKEKLEIKILKQTKIIAMTKIPNEKRALSFIFISTALSQTQIIYVRQTLPYIVTYIHLCVFICM